MPERRADIQGLRAVAVLLVIAFHADLPLPGGFAGVDIFFVISGYVIAAMLLREQSRTGGRIRLGAFYVRRFKRLTPALAVVVLVTMLASILLLSPFGTQQVAAKTGVGAMLLIANLVIARDTGGYFDAAAGSNPLLHTWSLSVEEQFYLVFPALLLVAARSCRLPRRRTATALVALVTAISFGLMLAGVGQASAALGFYSPVTRAWEFGAGALLALGAIPSIRGRSAASTVVGAAGLGLLAASAFVLDSSRPFPSLWTLLPVIGAALLLHAGCAANTVSRVLGHPILARTGDLSYSLYLWHWPFIVLARTAWPDRTWVPLLAALVSVAPALASYHWIEQPFRVRSLGGLRRGSLTVAAVALTPILLGAALHVGAGRGWGVERVVLAQRTAAEPRTAFTECLTQDTTGGAPADFARCRFGVDRPGSPIQLVGDSNAAMYAEAVLAAGGRLNRPVVIRTAAGCPFADVQRGTDQGQDATDRACRRYYEDTLRSILDGPPSTIVVAESTSQVLLPGRDLGASANSMVERPMSRLRVLAAGLDRTVARLRAARSATVLVEPIYWTGGSTTPVTEAMCPTMLGLLRHTCPTSMPLADIGVDQRTVRARIRMLAATSGAAEVDTIDEQCPDHQCGSRSGGTAVYSDNGHLSAALSTRLGARFAAAISRAATSPRGSPADASPARDGCCGRVRPDR